MNNILYVGKVPFGIAEEYINQFLGKIEQVVSMSFFSDQRSCRPKWFGYMEMASEAEAIKAMKALNGRMMLNRPLTTLNRNIGMLASKPCAFCISKETCMKPETERDDNCKYYMLRTGR